ncbi:ornithine cyclodeaminase [Roseibium aggregatum]|uniref:ornithine cyclodeaminase n=1 Tax=Roseibium aggregatum TaxID=187304 RepID=UPI0025AB77D9|nr:ornithine cyclodeaminase [Roseibium aggregatum]WJS05492.1 ornithine cyclodeaminase [Roseibium aggregatum]
MSSLDIPLPAAIHTDTVELQSVAGTIFAPMDAGFPAPIVIGPGDGVAGRPQNVGEKLTQAVVGDLVRNALQALCKGEAYGSKVALQPDHSELTRLTGQLDERLGLEEQRLNWKLSALVSFNEVYGAVKIVGSNAYNRTLGLPRSRSTILLFDKLTMLPVIVLDGTEISAARTGAYASIVADHFLPDYQTFRVFLFGAGKVAERAILDLAVRHGERIERIYVKTRSGESAAKLAAQFAHLPFKIVASAEAAELKTCNLVITASNAAKPLFDADQLSHDVVVLHLGGLETPDRFIRRALEAGTVFCDDTEAVCHRGSQSLAHYFKSRGQSLLEEAPKFQIGNLWTLPRTPEVRYRKPVLITCVGLPVLDLFVAQRVFEAVAPVTDRRKSAW